MMLLTFLLLSRAAVPNLGYAYPPEVREKTQGVRQIIISLRITLRLLKKQLTIAHKGVRKFYFSACGYAS